MPKGRIPLRLALAQRALELGLAELGKTTTIFGMRLVLRERNYFFDGEKRYEQHIFWSGNSVCPNSEDSLVFPVRADVTVFGTDKVCVSIWVRTSPDNPFPANGRYAYTPQEDAIEVHVLPAEMYPPARIKFH